MITFNGRYFKSVGIGGMRVTFATMGGKWIVGGWLKSATMAALHAAFGTEDGYKVIRATTLYLDDMALTDMQKAQSLADYIYEDPMLVCSLGLQPIGMEERMPVRYLQGDGFAKFDTGVYLEEEGHIELKCKLGEFKIAGTANYPMIIGTRWHGSFPTICMDMASQTDVQFQVSNTNLRSIWVGEYAEVHATLSWKEYSVNGTTYKSNKVKQKTVETLYLMGVRSYAAWSGRLYYCIISHGEERTAHFIPCNHNGENGMYDIERMQWFGNANTTGSFSISYTLPDGTTWTPLNQL